VALRDPASAGGVLGRVSLSDAALSGSGTALHGAHIVDPRTGRPAAAARAAWSLAPTAGLADALSTAFMVLTPDGVADCCARDPRIAAWVLVDGPAGPELRACGGTCNRQDAEARQERQVD
jgi:thiamine biosynthesis lipoprotein